MVVAEAREGEKSRNAVRMVRRTDMVCVDLGRSGVTDRSLSAAQSSVPTPLRQALHTLACSKPISSLDACKLWAMKAIETRLILDSFCLSESN